MYSRNCCWINESGLPDAHPHAGISCLVSTWKHLLLRQDRDNCDGSGEDGGEGGSDSV